MVIVVLLEFEGVKKMGIYLTIIGIIIWTILNLAILYASAGILSDVRFGYGHENKYEALKLICGVIILLVFVYSTIGEVTFCLTGNLNIIGV